MGTAAAQTGETTDGTTGETGETTGETGEKTGETGEKTAGTAADPGPGEEFLLKDVAARLTGELVC